MATFPCTPAIGLAVAARLVRANIPFTLDVKSQTMAEIQCKFQDTLEAAVMQVDNEHRRIQATIEGVNGLPVGRILEFECSIDGYRLPPSQFHTVDRVLALANLNDWEDATHQITFDNGANWTNVKLKYGYYLACSDGKRSWRADSIDAANVVKRPVEPVNQAQPGKRIPVAFSDPVHQERYDRGVCVQCNNVPGPCSLCGGTV